MGKVTKIVANVVASIVLGVAGLLLAVMLLLDVGVVQKILSDRASRFASDFLQTKVSVSAINLTGYNRLTLRDFYVEDYSGDTLLYVKSAAARIDLNAIIKGDVVLSNVKADGAKLLLHDDGSGKVNIAQITELLIPKEKSENPQPVILRGIEITDSQFRYIKDDRIAVGEGMIDWGDMCFERLNAKADRLIITGSRIEMGLHDVNLTDRSGAVFSDISVKQFVIDRGLLEFTDTDIKLPNTDLELPLIKLFADNGWKAWRSYTDSVVMDIRISGSQIAAEDLSYFVPFVKREQNFILRNVTVNLIGTTDDFRGSVENIDVYDTKLRGQYHVSNVVSKPMRFDGNISQLTTYAPDIERLVRQFELKGLSEEQIAMLSRLGAIGIEAEAEGELGDFKVKSALNTDLGAILAEARVGIGDTGVMLHNANVSSEEFNVGFLTRTRELGRVGFSVSGDMTDYTAHISQVDFNGYTYHNISASGSFKDNTIIANVVSLDPSATFSLDGSYKIEDTPQYSVTADIDRIDLRAINFNRKDNVSVISARFKASGRGLTLNDLTAEATFDDIEYIHAGGTYSMDAISIEASNTPELHSLNLRSEPFTAEYNSSADYRSSFGYLSDILYAFVPALPGGEQELDESEEEFGEQPQNETAPSHIRVRINDINPLLGAIVPGLYVAKGTDIALDYDPSERDLTLAATSDYLEWRETPDKAPLSLSRFVLQGASYGRADSLHLNLKTAAAIFAGFRINAVQGDVAVLNNQADFHLSASSNVMSMAARLNGVVDLGRSESGKLVITGEIAPSTFSIDGQTWALTSKQVHILQDRIDIGELRMVSPSGHLFIDGALADGANDVLNVDITDLDIEPLIRLLRIDKVGVDGVLNGNAKILSLKNGLLAEADITTSKVIINGHDVVPLSLHLYSDPDRRRNRFSIASETGHKEFVRGYFSTIDDEYGVRGGVHGVLLGIVQPFLGDAVSNPTGEVDIDFDISKLKGAEPFISGLVTMRDVETTVSFNNVSYRLANAKVTINNGVATLPLTTITDSEGQTAKLTAKADFKNFSNITYSANLQADELFVLNTTFAQNPTFYGKMFVTGKVDMWGDAKGMNVDVVAETGNGSSFHLPMTSTRQVINDDFVVFESRNTPTVQEETDMNASTTPRKLNLSKRKPNINININLTVRPNTEVNLVLDPATNDAIRAVGDAILAIKIAPQSDVFTLDGTYEISDGDYTLNVQNITSRKFAIEQGSTIRWSGEPLQPSLDIRAVYSLRTSLSPLKNLIVSDVEQVGQSFVVRVPVDCIVHIGDKLSNPTIEPDIKVRVSDPQMEAVIENAIATQDVKLTQFAWLLAFGEFFAGGNVTNEAVNLTDVGLATAASAGSGIVTSELNKLISPELGLRFNVDYHPRSEITSSEVVFGVTKELTDRLTLQVSGDFDTGDNQSVNNASNVRQGTLIPDASITWDISNNFNGRLFYRPIDQYNINTDKGTGEFGVGVSYRIDFNSFRELIERIGGKKKPAEN